MASTVIPYGERYFEAPAASADVWSYYAVIALAVEYDAPAWMRAFSDDLLCSIAVGLGVGPSNLIEHAQSGEHNVKDVLWLNDRVQDLLKLEGDAISPAKFDAIGMPGYAPAKEPMPLDHVYRFCRSMRVLLTNGIPDEKCWEFH